MGKKSDNAEVLKRVEEVLRIRLDGAQFHDIREYAVEKQWNVSDTQLRRYIQRADELLVQRQDKSRKQVIARHLSQRQALFARALKAGDYRTALAILADEAKLRGLYPEKEIKELVRLAAAQGLRIEELERRLRDAHTHATTSPPTSPECHAPGPPPGGDAADGGPDRPLPVGPVQPDA
jgi:hypothetical protein